MLVSLLPYLWFSFFFVIISHTIISRTILVCTCTIVLLYSCVSKKKSPGDTIVEPSFYHWKTSFHPTPYETSILHKNNVRDIYLRFFDVAWDAASNKPSPIAQLRVGDKAFFLKEKMGVIPTVFITNECIRNIEPAQCRPLAENIYKLISNIALANSIDSIKEIQIDCDWTVATREKYFSLLTELQKIDTLHLYSATIRLFQVKYPEDAGIPPVKKGLLMCYNMGNLKDPATTNSILDPATLQKYTGVLHQYPLPLDVALPLFSWYVLYRQNEYKGLIQSIDQYSLAALAKPIGKNRFEIIKDTSWNTIALKKGDLLRFENAPYQQLLRAAAIIKQKLSNKQLRLSLYHLDSITLSKYSAHEMEAIFRSLR